MKGGGHLVAKPAFDRIYLPLFGLNCESEDSVVLCDSQKPLVLRVGLDGAGAVVGPNPRPCPFGRDSAGDCDGGEKCARPADPPTAANEHVLPVPGAAHRLDDG